MRERATKEVKQKGERVETERERGRDEHATGLKFKMCKPSGACS